MRRTLFGADAVLGAVAVFVALTGRVAADDPDVVRFGFLASEEGLVAPDPQSDPDSEALGLLLLGVPPVDEIAAASAARSDDDLVGEEGRRPPPRRPAPPEVRTGPLSYGLTDRWTAKISYHHELLFPTATGKDLRTRRFSLFAAQPDRDVLDMNLSWRLSWSELNFGYQLQSDRAALAAPSQSYSLGGFADQSVFDYALTIGITRRFGGSK